MMKLVLMSDTHEKHRDLIVPEGDVLIHCGDFTNQGEHWPMVKFIAWFSNLPHPHKILIAGNHDLVLDSDSGSCVVREIRSRGIHYLENSDVTIDGVKFYGSPITPIFFYWGFMRQRGPEIRKYWDAIPDDTDVLITHGPPLFILDKHQKSMSYCGCGDLLEVVQQKKPKLHVFGHIHENDRLKTIGETTFINCSIVNDRHKVIHQPIVYFINKEINHEKENTSSNLT